MAKTFNNYCYARSRDLLVNIPSENYAGILRGSFHPIAPDVLEYIQMGVQWDPRWGYNIFHTFDNGFVVSYMYNFYISSILYSLGPLVCKPVHEDVLARRRVPSLEGMVLCHHVYARARREWFLAGDFAAKYRLRVMDCIMGKSLVHLLLFAHLNLVLVYREPHR
jgi:hypothetical protein